MPDELKQPKNTPLVDPTNPSDEELLHLALDGTGGKLNLRAVFAAGRVSAPPTPVTRGDVTRAVWWALEPHVERAIDLDLNVPQQSNTFKGIVLDVTNAVLALITKGDKK